MAKKGIKVKDLAQELGVTSRELIDRCRAEGIAVQNSITKLASANAQQVRGWYGSTADGTQSEPESGQSRLDVDR